MLGRYYDKTVDSYMNCVKGAIDSYSTLIKQPEYRTKIVNLIVDNEKAIEKVVDQVQELAGTLKDIIDNKKNNNNVKGIDKIMKDWAKTFRSDLEKDAQSFQNTVEEAYEETIKELEAEEAMK
jgi:hypothetical protein